MVLYSSHVSLLDFEFCIKNRSQPCHCYHFILKMYPFFTELSLMKIISKVLCLVELKILYEKYKSAQSHYNAVLPSSLMLQYCTDGALGLVVEIITIHFRKQDFQSFLLQLSYFQLYCFLQKVLRVSDECHVFFLIFFQFDVLLNKSTLEISVSYSGVTKHNSFRNKKFSID